MLYKNFLNRYKNYLKISYQNLNLSYSNSFLKFLWHPIAFFVLLIVKIYLFTNIFDNGDRFKIHIGSGLLFWFFFIQIVGSGLSFFKSEIFINVNIKPLIFLNIKYIELIFKFCLNIFVFIFVYYFLNIKVNYFGIIFASLVIISIFYQLFKIITVILFINEDLTNLINSLTIVLFFFNTHYMGDIIFK